jgi:Glyoxalase-like domain
MLPRGHIAPEIAHRASDEYGAGSVAGRAARLNQVRLRESPGYVSTMPSVIKSVSFDAVDALALARFWAAVFGSDVDEDSTTDKAFVEAAGWGGPNLWFTRVPEPKAAKNRMHFDLRAPGTVAAEVSRLETLGATVVRDDPRLTVMQDPEGNEFCVEPGPGQ